TQTLKLDGTTANLMIALALLLGTPFFIFFGWLSDKIGRKPILLAGCLIAALTYFPLFTMLAKTTNPNLINATENVKLVLTADPAECGTLFDPVGVRTFTKPCDVVRRTLATNSIHYDLVPGPAGSALKATVNGADAPSGVNELVAAAQAAGYPKAGDASILKTPSLGELFSSSRALQAVGILFLFVLFVTMVYGPIAALLVELFPTRIRYSGMSLPYHIGNGWFGGFLPPTAFAIVAASGNIFSGLWYPIIVALGTFVIGLLFLPETKDRDILK
ncbi:MFS transporter, partial [Bosea sp. (in: a-proteobacteria)]|uniref:MFS transporter n=1 Tax=Bosea sp. (in: a-proteobacteria) TaxID=1871050 RepID=UPI00333F1925